jgi:hypothetical protein
MDDRIPAMTGQGHRDHRRVRRRELASRDDAADDVGDVA